MGKSGVRTQTAVLQVLILSFKLSPGRWYVKPFEELLRRFMGKMHWLSDRASMTNIDHADK